MPQKHLNKKYYKTTLGKEPAREFIDSLDAMPKARVFKQIDKLKAGNPGQGHGVGKVQELVIDDGPGYRVYYALVDGFTLILLLTGGDKKTQQEDIKTAAAYLENYNKLAKEAQEAKDKKDGKTKGAGHGKK